MTDQANLKQIDTPALLVDAARYEQNIKSCLEHFAGTGVTVRPHLKTAKSPIIAKHLLAAGARGVCVAKLGEAEVMAAHDITDILITTEVVGAVKVRRLVELVARHLEVKTVLDSLAGASAINAVAGELSVSVKVLLDVNVGQNRCGVEPESAATFAQNLEQFSNLELIGVQGYEGHLQHIRDPQERQVQARAAMDRLAIAVRAIRDLGSLCQSFRLVAPEPACSAPSIQLSPKFNPDRSFSWTAITWQPVGCRTPRH